MYLCICVLVCVPVLICIKKLLNDPAHAMMGVEIVCACMSLFACACVLV